MKFLTTAPGMTQEVVDNIFNLFYSTKGKKGTGLGLYLTNKIIQQHGGEINVDSQPGQGTNIRITLPRHSTDEDEAPSDPA